VTGQLDLSFGAFGRRARVVKRGLQLLHVLLGFGKRGSLLVYDILVRLWTDAEQLIARL
jgi:hypothetical protein